MTRAWEAWLGPVGRLGSRIVLKYSFDLSLIFIGGIHFTEHFGGLCT